MKKLSNEQMENLQGGLRIPYGTCFGWELTSLSAMDASGNIVNVDLWLTGAQGQMLTC